MVHVDIGEAQSCAAHRSGKVTCRGSGRPAMVVTGLQDVVEVAARDTRPCARTSRGEVWCWRYDSGDPPERLDDRNDALQLADSRHSGDLFVLRGDGTVTRNSLDGSTRTIADVSDAVGVAAGGLFACILHAHGGASCIDELEDTPTLRPVTDSHDLAQLVVGGREVCGVTRAGAVRCWKAGIDTPQLDPWDASLRLPGVRLAAGHEFACALTGDGAVDCWGRPPWPANGPRVEGLSGVTDLFAGPRQVCARKSDESMWCWGDDLRGQIGDGQLPREFGTTRISGVQALAAGPNVTCAAAKDGPVRCWGTAAIWTAPKQIGSIAGVTRMALSEAALCVMTADAIACRGLPHLDPESGQLRSDAAWRTLAASADAIDLDVQGSTVCALRRTGHVECRDLTRASGSDRLDGHVGDAVELALPTQGGSLYVRTRAGEIRCLGPPDECVDTSALHGTSRIAAGSRHLCALSSGGLVQCAGDNTQGQLGGVSNRPSEPVTLAGSYLAIAAYRHRTCAITATERAVMCWGATPGQRATEVRPVDGLEGPAVALAVSASHVCVALADGTIKCRGARDRNGELGSGRAVVVPRPRRLNTLVDIQ